MAVKEEKLLELTKEIPFKWKVQTSNEYNALCVAYARIRSSSMSSLSLPVCRQGTVCQVHYQAPVLPSNICSAFRPLLLGLRIDKSCGVQ